jgi:hypothetical protein
VVFREYECQHDTDALRQVEAHETCIYLVSERLCTFLYWWLGDDILGSVFDPHTELRPPYNWFHHNRNKATYPLTDPHMWPWDQSQQKETQDAADVMLRFVRECMHACYKDLEESLKSVIPVITWQQLPLIFVSIPFFHSCLCLPPVPVELLVLFTLLHPMPV